MKYFVAKQQVINDTPCNIISLDGTCKAAIPIDDCRSLYIVSGDLPANQPTECEVTEKDYEEVEDIIKQSFLYKEINLIVLNRIRQKYDEGKEFEIINRAVIYGKTDPEYVEYSEYKESCIQIGRNMKLQLGLILES